MLFLLTIHSSANKEYMEKKRKKLANKEAQLQAIREILSSNTFKIIPIPTVTAKYNNEMNHFDRGD